MADMERLLIYVDILGFKRRVQTMPIEDCVREIKVLLWGVYAGAIRNAFRRAPHEVENLLKKPNFRSEDEDFNFVKHEVKKQTASTLFYSQILWFSTPTACGQMPRTSRSE
jgi:hypothetical protein